MADKPAEQQLGWWDRLFPTKRVLNQAAEHVAGQPGAATATVKTQPAAQPTDTSYIKGQISQHMGVVEPAKKKPVPPLRGLRKALPK